jgi:hypothetical protein
MGAAANCRPAAAAQTCVGEAIGVSPACKGAGKTHFRPYETGRRLPDTVPHSRTSSIPCATAEIGHDYRIRAAHTIIVVKSQAGSPRMRYTNI